MFIVLFVILMCRSYHHLDWPKLVHLHLSRKVCFLSAKIDGPGVSLAPVPGPLSIVAGHRGGFSRLESGTTTPLPPRSDLVSVRISSMSKKNKCQNR